MPVEPMDNNSTHSTTSSSGGGAAQQQPAAASASAAPKATNTARKQQTQQLVKLREANAKYKDLLKLAKERIQEQEGVLDDRRCEYFIIWFIYVCTYDQVICV